MLAPLDSGRDEVPDPYCGGAKGFEEVLDLLETASDVWVKRWQAATQNG